MQNIEKNNIKINLIDLYYLNKTNKNNHIYNMSLPVKKNYLIKQ